MLFSSLIFLCLFLPVTLALYYLLPVQLKNPLLLAASLLFYAWGEPVYILLMVISILFNWYMGMALGEAREDGGYRKWLLWSDVAMNLLILGFFKYSGFLVENFNAIFHTHLVMKDLPLPIGISFYTFQALSYVIDVYRGNVRRQRNLISFGVYISCFPQLIAGPIVQYRDIEEQIDHPERRGFHLAASGSGASIFIIGLAKKVLLANQVGALYDSYMSGTSLSMTGYLIAALMYSFQIYFDFSGYSDMAIGLGKMLGFTFPKNFKYPYLSTSITEFWRRWHITLGAWFRDYVYIPLGGNRVNVGRHIINIMIVWMLTGLWHGASWNFVLWGLYYGVLLLIEKYWLGEVWKRFKPLGWLVTMILVAYGWVIFASDGAHPFAELVETTKGLLGIGVPFISDWVRSNAGPVIRLTLICLIGMTDLPKRLHNMLMDYRKDESKPMQYAIITLVTGTRILMLVASVAYLAYSGYNPFLYFRF